MRPCNSPDLWFWVANMQINQPLQEPAPHVTAKCSGLCAAFQRYGGAGKTLQGNN